MQIKNELIGINGMRNYRRPIARLKIAWHFIEETPKQFPFLEKEGPLQENKPDVDVSTLQARYLPEAFDGIIVL